MHAIVTNVEFQLDRITEATAMLTERIVPQAKASAGFVGGYWTHSADHALGTSIEVFESLSAAETALQSRPTEAPPGAPFTLISARLMDIAATAP